MHFLIILLFVYRDGVTNYPRKGKMTAAKPARNIVLVVERTGSGPEVMEYLLWQRPSTGKKYEKKKRMG